MTKTRNANIYSGQSGEFLHSNPLNDVQVFIALCWGLAIELYNDDNTPIANYSCRLYQTDSDGFAYLGSHKTKRLNRYLVFFTKEIDAETLEDARRKFFDLYGKMKTEEFKDEFEIEEKFYQPDKTGQYGNNA